MKHTPGSVPDSITSSSPRMLVEAAMETQSNMEQLIEGFLIRSIPKNYADGEEFTINIIDYMKHLGLTWSREELFQIDSKKAGEEYELVKFCKNELSKILRKLSIGANWPYGSMFDNKESVIAACYITRGKIKPFGASGSAYIGMTDFSHNHTTKSPTKKQLFKALINRESDEEIRIISPHTRAYSLGEITGEKAQEILANS